ncbi:hypothetical protein LPJ59_001107 [Coemansia sp. RSA 2399]|nr:hypothetical protein LPJ59_001107 [Coemansia sp. RSA 2399]KAJ1907017.1 hypothetical protein LPJ81_001018 [Coemansia sp. IMI 209127]
MEQLNSASTSKHSSNPGQVELSMDSLQSAATIAPKQQFSAGVNEAVYPTFTYQSPRAPTTLGAGQQYIMPQAEYPQPHQYQQPREQPAPATQQQAQPPQPSYADPKLWQQEQQNEQPRDNNAGNWQGANAEYPVPPTAPQQQQQHHHFLSHHAGNGPQTAQSQPNMHTQFINTPISHFVPGGGHHPTRPPTTVPEKDSKPIGRSHTLLSCLRDGLSNLTIVELAPISTLATAAFLHHYRHRHSNDFIPYKPPKWVKYIKNTMYAYSSYRFLINNGIIKKGATREPIVPTPGEGGARGLPTNGYPLEHYEYGNMAPENREYRSRSLEHHGYGSRSLEHAGGMSAAAAHGGDNIQAPSVFVFDPRHAIPKAYAKDYYRYVYDDDADLRRTPAYVLAGAAAMRALRNEAHTLSMMASEEPHMLAELDGEQMAMGMAIAESEECLARKQHQVGLRLAKDDTIEYIGRIALATMGKIREDKRLKVASKSSNASQYAYGEALGQAQEKHRPTHRGSGNSGHYNNSYSNGNMSYY